ncbi:MAG: SLC13 family permease [Candidatus Zixiibacteriota bacterium]
MDWIVITVFIIVYLGMIAGRIPGLALDRTGVALLGAIVLLASGTVRTSDLPEAVDIGTIALLFGLMILSAQFRLAGTYSSIVRKIGSYRLEPQRLLVLIILISAVLSALLINDVVCLAMTPIVIAICYKHRFNPIPFLLGVAGASNIGSAATLVGNPQNILIGQTLALSFSRYLWYSTIPVMASTLLLWLIISYQYRKQWYAPIEEPGVVVPLFSRWQTIKGTVIAGLLLVVFLTGLFPRDLAALGVAGLLLCSRRMRSREILGIVDWQLLVLFISLFIVNFALNASNALQLFHSVALGAGLDMSHPGWLYLVSAALSNIVSNVPAVMLLLPLAKHPMAGPALALSSTLAGNLIIVGSIANIIVVDQAARLGINISWTQHAKTGIPVTLITLIVAGLWLWLCS